MAFRGHYDYSLDAKNRVNVPPKFRAAFSAGALLAPGLDPCVEIWTPEAFDGYTDSVLPNLVAVSRERRKLGRFFAHNSFDAELDGAGRITLNPALLKHAGIEKDVVVAGSLDHVEIWDRDRWLTDQRELSAEIVGIAESLGNPA